MKNYVVEFFFHPDFAISIVVSVDPLEIKEDAASPLAIVQDKARQYILSEYRLGSEGFLRYLKSCLEIAQDNESVIVRELM